MLLTPRYDGPPVLTTEGDPGDVLVPLTRQRRRLLALLDGLSDEQWRAPTRCDGWSVQDVISHLVTVDGFWLGSIGAGLGGTPTAYLAGFDPAATPPLMVDPMRALPPSEVLAQFREACEGFLGVVADLDDAGWSAIAESPAGHVTVRLVCAHALWDCWIHERDIALPLDLATVDEPDEVSVCLRYAAALSPTFALSGGSPQRGTFAVEATDPDLSFVLEVTDSVHLRSTVGTDEGPCLRGPAVELVESLSFRAPLAASAPTEWRELLGGLAQVFDTEVEQV